MFNVVATHCAVVVLMLAACAPANADRNAACTDEGLLAEHLMKAEAELAGATTEYDRWLSLTHLVLVEARDRPATTVRRHAEEALRLANGYQDDWNYGNAIHKANLALGRVALRENDLDGATRFLLRAGATPGSPQLNTFGPNMLLAKELFERGETGVLLEYFQLCGRFWEEHGEELSGWSQQVRQNVQPDFGANVLY